MNSLAQAATLETHAPGSDALAGQDLVFLSWVPKGEGSVRDLAEEAYDEILGTLERSGAVVLQERIFGRGEAAQGVLEVRDEVWERRESLPAPAPTFVEGVPLRSKDLAGIHVIAARGRGGAGRLLLRDGHVCGRVIHTSGGELFALSDPGRFVRDRGLDGATETREVLRVAEGLLAEQGWGFGDVGRTWFYLRDILDWYGAFNRARNDEFRRMGLLREDPRAV